VRYFLEAYKREHGKMPSLEKCAEECRVTLPTLKSYMEHFQRPTSLDQVADKSESAGQRDNTLLDLIPCPRSGPNDELEIMSGLERLEDLLSDLSPKDRKMVEMRYGLNGEEKMTYAKIAEQMDISRERVRQIEIRSLKKMRSKLERRNASEDS
jgi:RNA polymerase sigma factor (sigma-70 family)